MIYGKSAGEYTAGVLVKNEETGKNIHLLAFRIFPSSKNHAQRRVDENSKISNPVSRKHAHGAPPLRPYPGQFYHFLCSENDSFERILRRPLSALDACGWETECTVNAENRSGNDFLLYFLVEIAGVGTQWLCSLEEGSRVDMLGPLGRGYPFVSFLKQAGCGFHTGEVSREPFLQEEISRNRDQKGGCASEGALKNVLLVAGGMGIVPLYFAALELERMGRNYTMIAGFRSKDKLFHGLNSLKGDVRIYTDDGTSGTKGMASDGLSAVDLSAYSVVFTCGPTAMMKAAHFMADAFGVPCYISLTSRMGCGIGLCGCCVVKGAKKNLRVCSEGPVFIASDFFK